MREKLIELLEDGLEESELQTNPEGECLGTDIEKFADYLLQNGVIIPIYCKDCEYWNKQKDSLQGRCALSGNYPTGTWYCANAKRRDEK